MKEDFDATNKQVAELQASVKELVSTHVFIDCSVSHLLLQENTVAQLTEQSTKSQAQSKLAMQSTKEVNKVKDQLSADLAAVKQTLEEAEKSKAELSESILKHVDLRSSVHFDII